MSTATIPASASEALDMVHAGLAFLAAADAAAMGAAERAGCLRGLEQADAVATAARTSVLGAFAAGQDYADDGDYSACSWLRYRTQVTQGTAADHTAWVRRGDGHRAVMAALAGRKVSKSYAREICWWTGKLPEDARPAADEILLGAAASGLGLEDLAGLAAEMYEKSRQGQPDADPGDDGPGVSFDDRSVRLATTIGGAGVVHGDLTPECAEFVRTVLDALSAPAGADEDRTHEQRYHDALEEAMRRLVAGGLVPQRGGQPIRVWAYISLADLMQLDGSAELLREWAERLHAQWAGRRAAAAEAGGHQGLWLDGEAAKGIACGAPVTPVVVGSVNPAAFGDLIKLCAQLDELLGLRGGEPGEDDPGAGQPGGGDPGAGQPGAGGAADGSAGSAAVAQEALVQAILGKAVELLSGPGGLASFLRRHLGLRAGGPSLPLDIGYSETIPASIRNAVRLRDMHCQWAGRCRQPAVACQVHHTRHKANGGKTSLKDCVLLCHYHHQVMIHRLGWTLVVNPTAPPPRGTRTRPRCCTATGRRPGPDNSPGITESRGDRHRMTPARKPWRAGGWRAGLGASGRWPARGSRVPGGGAAGDRGTPPGAPGRIRVRSGRGVTLPVRVR